jgi:secreted PhoX family phosphatase
MWVGDQVNSINGFSNAEITTSGTPTPLGIDIAIPGTAALAFDVQGNLWVAAGYGCTPTGGSGCGGNVTGYLFEYTPAQLASNGVNVSPTVTIALPSPTSGQATFPYGIAFDRNGTLWVAGSNQLVLYGFGANQLSTSGSPTPAHVLTVATLASGLSGLAFDPSGNLWIGVQNDPNGSNGGGAIIELTPSQLGAASGTPTPRDSLIGAGATVGIATPNFLAFDTQGNLWVSGSQDTVVMFSNASLLALPTTSSPAPAVTLTTPFTALPEGLAFDAGGNLWLSLFPQGGPHQTAVVRYPASAITSGGNGVPDITLSLTSNSQSAPLGGLSGIAFAPGAGQGLFGATTRRHHP